jgi:chemotaxis protein CheX
MKTANEIAQHNGIPENWQPFLELAAREVFEIMLGCKLEPQDPVSPATAEITAMVGLAGQLCGLLTLRCSSQSAALMASKMLGVSVSQADEQMWDAMGEIANMVAGNFKNKLTGMADRCMLSVPTVITGSDYSCRSMADTGPLEVTMLFEGAPVTVAVEIHT